MDLEGWVEESHGGVRAMKYQLEEAVVCIVGLGYVGLPLVEAFSRRLKVVGFDTNSQKVKELKQRWIQRSTFNGLRSNLTITTDAKKISRADFIIICVPTPVTKSKEPDLSYVKEAAKTVGRNMKKGSVVILESTVYPGVTEEIEKPILEKKSGLRCGVDFKIAYSPERVNPGDKEHTVDRITKVVAGMDEETTEVVTELYRLVTPHIFKARNIKTAEAAKVIENIQRNLNIALMNELAIVFGKIGLNTKDVLKAAMTKWNFHFYSPGLVGGHCIPVDPYYLVYKARDLGHHPQIILAGTAINDYMPKYVAEMTIKALNKSGKVIKDSRVLVLGLTYKEDVPDIRESPVREIIKELEEYGVEVTGHDPFLDASDFEREFNIKLFRSLEEVKGAKVDCIILAVTHLPFRGLSLADFKEMQNDEAILIDVRGIFDPEEVKRSGIHYKTL